MNRDERWGSLRRARGSFTDFQGAKSTNDTATRARCCLVAPIPQCLKQGIRLCLVECASKLTMLYVVGDAKWSTVSPEDNQKT